MGLDMYLNKKTYVGNEYAKETNQLTIGQPGQYGGKIQDKRISEIVERIGYWRKANAIHAWFVRNVQGGVDECQESCVTAEQLRELRSACRTVLASVETHPEICAKLLPAQDGFFFGNTDYDQYYLDDLKETVKIIDSALEEKDGEFYYQASW